VWLKVDGVVKAYLSAMKPLEESDAMHGRTTQA